MASAGRLCKRLLEHRKLHNYTVLQHIRPQVTAQGAKQHVDRFLQRQYSNSSDKHSIITEHNGETVIHSPYADFKPDERTFGEVMFSFLDEYKNLELMVG